MDRDAPLEMEADVWCVCGGSEAKSAKPPPPATAVAAAPGDEGSSFTSYLTSCLMSYLRLWRGYEGRSEGKAALLNSEADDTIGDICWPHGEP